MEVIGFAGAVIGLIAAFVNRRRIIEIRHVREVRHGQSSPAPLGIRRRLKRLLVCFGLMIFCAVIGGDPPSEAVLFPFGICLLAGAYQVLAIVILTFGRIWR